MKAIDMEEKLRIERECQAAGCAYIAGTDEVGRGPLAGPLVCAAVVMPLGEGEIISGVDDSKKVSAKKREILAEEIKKRAIAYKICEIPPERIDEINILNAVKECMKACTDGLSVKPDVLLVDAVEADFGVPHRSVVKGDAKSYTIGAASIIAKVYRDHLMEDLDAVYPGYGFAQNKGYGTAEHIRKIKEIGPCLIHRKTFIKNFWDEAENKPR